MHFKWLWHNFFQFQGALFLVFFITFGAFLVPQARVLADCETECTYSDRTDEEKDTCRQACNVPAANARDDGSTQNTPAPKPPEDTSLTFTGETLDIILTPLTTILDYIAAGIVKLTLVIMEMILIPILNYNSFSTSPIIGLGWSLVRDVMNMFVIISLLFIAIFTIVGNHRAHWEQQLPQLFLAVIFMNFSRTICGILIDISQVVMFTFVNALLDIAAGNFAQLFGLQEFGKYANQDILTSVANGTGLSTSSQFVAAFLRIPLYGAILAILFLLALAFLYRIVILWVLVILSPATFLLGGLKGVFGQAAGDHAQWWGKFTGALLMGPILTFFLWLSLAAASSGSIAQSENFPTPQNAQSYGLSLEVFDSSHLTSLILALILLIAGMQIAGEQSSKVGGLAGQMINEGMGQKVVSGALRAPFQAGAYAGRKADVYGAQLYGGNTIRESLGKNVIGAGERLAQTGGVGMYLGRAVAAVGGNIELQGEHLRAERTKAATERVGKMSDSEKAMHMGLLATGQKSNILSTKEDFDAVALDFMSDKVQDETKEHIAHNLGIRKNTGESDKDFEDRKEREVAPAFNRMMAQTLEFANAQKKAGKLDDSAKSKLTTLNTKYADLLKDPAETAKWVDDEKFNMNDARKRPEVVNNPAFREAAKRKVLRTTKDKDGVSRPVYLWDEIKKGVYGDKLKKAADSVETPRATTAQRVGEALNVSRTPQEDLEKHLNSKTDAVNIVGGLRNPESGTGPQEMVQPILQPADLTGNRSTEIGGAIVNSEVDITSSPIKTEIVQNIVSTQPADTIGKAFKNEQVKPADIPASAFEATNTNAPEVVRSVLTSQVDIRQMPPASQDAYKAGVERMQTDRTISAKEYTQAKSSLFSDPMRPIENTVPGITRDQATHQAVLDPSAKREMGEIFKHEPANFAHVSSEIPTDARTANDVTETVVRSANVKHITELGEKWKGATGQEKIDLKSAMDVIHQSIERELNAYDDHVKDLTPAERTHAEELENTSTTVRTRLGF